MRALKLVNKLSPGDVLVMSAAIHSLHRRHPGKYLTGVESSCPAVWENNPDVATTDQLLAAGGAEEIATHYPLVNECNQRAVHVLQGYCDFLAHALQVPIPLMTNRPLLYLSDQEKAWANQVEEVTGRRQQFWVICAGHKMDFTAKFWGTDNYQKLVDSLRGRVTFVQVGAAEHRHPPLRGVINLVGKTDARQLIRLCYHADGVVCGVTFLHHIAAALNKPSVVILGGREPVQWNAYPRCHLLHTGGALDSCRKVIGSEVGHACWRSRVIRLGDGSEQDGSLCADPTPGDDPIPRCQAMIRPETVADKVIDIQAAQAQ